MSDNTNLNGPLTEDEAKDFHAAIGVLTDAAFTGLRTIVATRGYVGTQPVVVVGVEDGEHVIPLCVMLAGEAGDIVTYGDGVEVEDNPAYQAPVPATV